jgi:Flp pilus assembly protein TadD
VVSARVRKVGGDRGVRAAEDALALRAECGWPEGVEADLRVSYAGALREAGRPTEGLAQAELARAVAERSGATRVVISALSMQIITLCNLGRAEEAVPVLAVYDAVARKPVDRAFVLYHGVSVARALGRDDEATELLRRLAALEVIDDANLTAGVNSELGEMLRKAGRLDEAIACYRTAARVGRGTPVGDLSYANLALALIDRGDWAGAEAIVLGSRWDPGRRSNSFIGAAMAEIAAFVAANAGDLPAFDAAWEELEALIGRSGVRDPDFRAVAHRVAARLDERDERQRAERVREFLRELG